MKLSFACSCMLRATSRLVKWDGAMPIILRHPTLPTVGSMRRWCCHRQSSIQFTALKVRRMQIVAATATATLPPRASPPRRSTTIRWRRTATCPAMILRCPDVGIASLRHHCIRAFGLHRPVDAIPHHRRPSTAVEAIVSGMGMERIAMGALESVMCTHQVWVHAA